MKGIFFDAGDTLFEAAEPIGVYYSRIAEDYNVKVDAKTLDQRFKAAFKMSPPLSFPGVSQDELEVLEYAWWRKIVFTVFEGIDFPQFDRYFETLYHVFEQKSTWRLFPEIKEVLMRLKNAGYTLGIISNFDSRLMTICTELGIRDYFDVIVFSSQASAAKPSPGIFVETLKRTGLSPAETVYVGDQLENDFKGAQSVGMSALLLDRPGHYGDMSGIRSISDLRGLDAFLSEI